MRFSPRRQATVAFLASAVATFGFGSDSCLAGGRQHGPVYRTLDTLAGGIESAIGVARGVTGRLRGGSPTPCDDGCDAMTLQELDSMSPATDDMPMMAAPISPPSSDLLPMPMMEPTPIEEMPQYQTPLPPSMPMGPRPMESRSVTPSVPQPQRSVIPQPIPDVRPNSKPAIPSRPNGPQVPANGQPSASPKSSGDDDWMEGFSNEPTQPTSRPRMQRTPAETIKSLPDPFKDDPQSKQAPRSLNSPASYWESW